MALFLTTLHLAIETETLEGAARMRDFLVEEAESLGYRMATTGPATLSKVTADFDHLSPGRNALQQQQHQGTGVIRCR